MFLPEQKEVKSKQVIFMVKPSQHQIIKRMATERDMTISEMILQLLDMEYNEPVLKYQDKQVQQKLI